MGPADRNASARRVAGKGLVQQQAAAADAGVWWGDQGFAVPRYGQFTAPVALISSGAAYGAYSQPRDLVGNRIAGVCGHRRESGKQVAVYSKPQGGGIGRVRQRWS